MNYYNPYFVPTTPSRFSLLARNINFNSILNGTQKTLNIINQTIPMIKQVKPIVNNAKTMFKVMNEFKKIDNKENDNKVIKEIEKTEEKKDYIEGPTFFV